MTKALRTIGVFAAILMAELALMICAASAQKAIPEKKDAAQTVAANTKPAPAKQAKAAEGSKPDIEPPAIWLEGLKGYLDLARVIQQMKEEQGIDKLELQLQKKGNNLAQQLPAGYTYDPAKKKFVDPKNLPQPTPPPAPAN